MGLLLSYARMDKDTRNFIFNTTQAIRRLLEEEFARQLEGTFDVHGDGRVAEQPGPQLTPAERLVRQRIVEAIQHRRAAGESAIDSVRGFLSEAVFTFLNRLAALKMMEARGLVLPCVSQGDQSQGFKEFSGLAPGLIELPDKGYRLYLECLFDEIGREVGVLYDRTDSASLLWPRRKPLETVLEKLNDPALTGVWAEDETIGWIYQYYNDPEERRAMRDQSSAPRNSRELAIRNQFFTPRYVVEFLTDNTLGRLWHEMTQGRTRLKDQCRYMVRRPDEVFLGQMTEAALECPAPGVIELAKQLQQGDATSFAEFTTDDASVQRMIDLAHTVDGYARHPGNEQTWQWVAEVRRNVFLPAAYTGTTTQDILDALFLECRADRHGGDGSIYRERWFVNACNEVRRRALRSRAPNLSQEELLRQPVHIPHRPLKDPREIRLLDPACGSMHFGLYAFDLFTVIYDEAWEIAHGTDDAAKSAETFAPFVTFAASFADKAAFLREVPRLIVEHNIHGIDIDPRAAQIAGLSLWLRAQRAWHQAGVKPADRPRITRSNLVCAEPMPGEKELLREFVESAFPAGERPALAFLLEKIFDRMTLAGEAGSLLRIEEEIRAAIAEAKRLWNEGPKHEQATLFPEATAKKGQGEMRLDLSGITDEQFWERAEQRIYDALEAYAEQAENGGGFQRRLFADDAAQGFAFIDLCRKRYDVVVMNPPFGEPAIASKEYVEAKYADSCQDIFAAFVERGITAAPRSGFVGVISTEAGFFRRTLEAWRRRVLLERSTMGVMAHLGGHVLDGATVRTATYVLQTPRVEAASLFLRLLGQEDREARFFDTVQVLKTGASAPNVYQTEQTEFEKLPYAVFGYWCSPEMRSAFVELPKVEDNAHVRQGLASGDDFRFLRLRWEVAEKTIGDKAVWACFAKGGEYSPYHDDVHLLVRWEHQGAEVKAAICQRYPYLNGQWQWVVKNTDYYFRPGITFPRRTNKRFAPRVMPGGCAFGDKGPAIIDIVGSPWGLLAVLNSRPLSYLMGLALGAAEAEGGAGANSYEVGLVQRLPIPSEALRDARLIELGKDCWAARSSSDSRKESCAVFIRRSPGEPNASIHASATALLEEDNKSASKYVELQKAIDARVTELYRFSSADWREIEEHAGELHIPSHSDEPDAFEFAASIVSHAIGCIFGRWDIRYATGERPAPELPDPFAPLPVCPPGMLQGDDGLPLSPEAGRRLRTEGRYPLDVAWDGILVDDPEHPLDLERRVHAALSVLWGDRADALEHEACALLGVPTLREWFRRPAGFFADHLKRYSKSRRQAPIYWPLSSPKNLYTVWLYYHRLTPDTLFTVLRDHVKPRLEFEERRAFQLQQEAGPTPSPSQRRDLAEAADLVEDIRAFKAELERVAPLFHPNLNDGVIINHAPLWRLAAHPKWRADCRATWEELANGDYDWAHLALHLWPERVIPKCATDRSLAIAHGLDEFFWEEIPLEEPAAPKSAKPGRKPKSKAVPPAAGAGEFSLEATATSPGTEAAAPAKSAGSGKWRPKKVPAAEVQKLTASRTSAAVKSALESLGGASPGESGPRRGRKKAGT